jgi:hypothetical protein
VNVEEHNTNRPRLKSWDEVMKLAEALDGSVKTAYLLSARAGLRPAETMALTWADVDLEGRQIRVWKQIASADDSPTRSDVSAHGADPGGAGQAPRRHQADSAGGQRARLSAAAPQEEERDARRVPRDVPGREVDPRGARARRSRRPASRPPISTTTAATRSRRWRRWAARPPGGCARSSATPTSSRPSSTSASATRRPPRRLRSGCSAAPISVARSPIDFCDHDRATTVAGARLDLTEAGGNMAYEQIEHLVWVDQHVVTLKDPTTDAPDAAGPEAGSGRNGPSVRGERDRGPR